MELNRLGFTLPLKLLLSFVANFLLFGDLIGHCFDDLSLINSFNKVIVKGVWGVLHPEIWIFSKLMTFFMVFELFLAN